MYSRRWPFFSSSYGRQTSRRAYNATPCRFDELNLILQLGQYECARTRTKGYPGMSGSPTNPRVELFTPQKNLWTLLLCSLAASVFCPVYGFGGWNVPHNELKVLAQAGSVIFPIASCLYVRRLMSRKPAMVIDGSGILIRTFGGSTFVSWDELDETAWTKVHGQRYLGLNLRPPPGRPWSFFKRLSMRFKKWMFGGHVLIQGYHLDYPLEDLEKHIRNCIIEYQTKS